MATKVTPTKSYIRKFGDVCRLCSSESGRLQLKIFSKSGEKKHMAEKIFKATGLRIENNTHFPQAICRKCERTVESIVSFQEKIVESQRVCENDSITKRVIDMSPSQIELSPIKKLATDKQASVSLPSSSRQLCFDDVEKISDVVPRQANVTVRHVVPNTNERVLERFVSVHNVNFSRYGQLAVQQPKSVQSKLADVFLAMPLTPSKTEALDRSTDTKEPTAVAHVIKTKVPTVMYGIKRDIVKSISDACSVLCRRRGGSVLYDKDFKEMSEFDFAKIWTEMVRSIPLFLDVLNSISGLTCDIDDTPLCMQIKYAFIYSILMNNRWHELSLVQRINTVLMIRGGGSKQVILNILHSNKL